MVNKKNTKKVPGGIFPMSLVEMAEMAKEHPEGEAKLEALIGGLVRKSKVEHTLWCKTKSFFKTLGLAIVDVIFLLSVFAIFGSIFLFIWDPVTANVQLFGTAVLFFVFLMTMIGIFNQD